MWEAQFDRADFILPSQVIITERNDKITLLASDVMPKLQQ